MSNQLWNQLALIGIGAAVWGMSVGMAVPVIAVDAATPDAATPEAREIASPADDDERGEDLEQEPNSQAETAAIPGSGSDSEQANQQHSSANTPIDSHQTIERIDAGQNQVPDAEESGTEPPITAADAPLPIAPAPLPETSPPDPPSTAPTATPGATALSIPSNGARTSSMAQLTSVSELADVQPSDWAYKALQSLVERYGCIVGYPDGTFRGERALSRYEFAAGLNACLDRISELIEASTADLVTEEDLAVRQRLADEFQTELAVLRGRVDGLEARVAELEANQFSATTVLRGNAIFAVADVFGEGDNNQTVFQHRENLSFVTSFTGDDVLLLSLYAGNTSFGSLNADPPYTGVFDRPGTEVDVLVGGVERPVKVSTAEGTLSSQLSALTTDTLQVRVASYSFPINRHINIAFAHGFAQFQLYAPTLNPYLSDFESGTGAISVFGEYNPIYTLTGGGTGLIFNATPFDDALQLTAGYLADGLAAGDPSPGSGLFNGGYGFLGQLTWNVTDNFSIAGVYINQYSPSGRFGFNYNGLEVAGTAVANTLAGQDLLASRFTGGLVTTIEDSPVITNGYGAQFNWQPSSRFSISGWFSTFYPRLIGEGDGNILTYALTFAFPDLFRRGNLLGLVVGAEPYLTRMGGDPQDFDVDVPLHIEAFYRHRVTDNIFITPGVIWLTAPNQDNDNPDAVIATLRTTFLF
ncbi:iron uptake porin [Leptolyngbya sp. NK1-12]|uniref:Iron uptake porin n=1 Tax=Leptolyngbya sp. NK1-12 TaxID=2547451 RepID=A0AA96WZ69_9CYAN|nr:iron uptake porin [Leptolyngbya sp. NK1-12]WNZ27612.1 iron uptake porin [Leptolyngbya sp. NK1-12]